MVYIVEAPVLVQSTATVTVLRESVSHSFQCSVLTMSIPSEMLYIYTKVACSFIYLCNLFGNDADMAIHHLYSRSFTISPIANELVKPGLSMPSKLTNPGKPSSF